MKVFGELRYLIHIIVLFIAFGVYESKTPQIPTPNPTRTPTRLPAAALPTVVPTIGITKVPTVIPSISPTRMPTRVPTKAPTPQPTRNPTRMPTRVPTKAPTPQPTRNPTRMPTRVPTKAPTPQPTRNPTRSPVISPTKKSSTISPSRSPTASPSLAPSRRPSTTPSTIPSVAPTVLPSVVPSEFPSALPSVEPSVPPTEEPTCSPSNVPTFDPTVQPTVSPTQDPTNEPSAVPSEVPTYSPTAEPTAEPSASPSSSPSEIPSVTPTTIPSIAPTKYPTVEPSMAPSDSPSFIPTTDPSHVPTAFPSVVPSTEPTDFPTFLPSTNPTMAPSENPSLFPTVDPTGDPTASPSAIPSQIPTEAPTETPTAGPTAVPTDSPTALPVVDPSEFPTISPTMKITSRPSAAPTIDRIYFPSCNCYLPSPLNPEHNGLSPVNFYSVGFQGKISLGTCVDWKSFIHHELKYRAEHPQISSFSLTSFDQVHVSEQFTTTCNDSAVVPPLFHSLLYPSSIITNFRCGMNNWKVKLCANMNPSICVNCSDPCHPKVSDELYLGPCDAIRSNSSRLTQLTISMNENTSPPLIMRTEISTTHTTADVNLTLSNGGLVACAVALKGKEIIDNVEAIWFQRKIAIVDSSFNAHLLFSRLLPNQEYELFCLTQNLVGSTTSWKQIESNKKTFKLRSFSSSSYPSPKIFNSTASWTYYNGYPKCCVGQPNYDPNYPKTECSEYSGCRHPGKFAAAGQRSLEFVQANNMIAFYDASDPTARNFHEKWGNKYITITGTCQGITKTFTALIADTCADPDCNGCCTRNSNPSTGFLIDMEYYTVMRQFGTTACADIIHTLSFSVDLHSPPAIPNCGGTFGACNGGQQCCSGYCSLNECPVENREDTLQKKFATEIHLHYEGSFVLTGQTSLDTVSLDIPATINSKNSVTVLGIFTQANKDLSQVVYNETFSLQGGRRKLPITKAMTQLEGNIAYTIILGSPNYTVTFSSLNQSENAMTRFQGNHYYSFTSHLSIRVISATTNGLFPFPNLNSAVFSSDGTEILLSFTEKTDMGLTSASNFMCSSILKFPGAENTQCYWQNAYTLVIVRSSLNIDDKIELLRNRIKPACPGANSCRNAPYLDSSFVLVTPPAPSDLQTPFISIVGSRLISFNQSASIDLSLSTGSGGRPWKKVSVKVITASSTASALNSYFNNVANASAVQPWIIPSRLLEEGSYIFLIELCNFIDACGIGSYELIVTRDYVPKATFLNPTTSIIHRSSSIEVTLADFDEYDWNYVEIAWKLESNGIPIDMKENSFHHFYRIPAFTFHSNQFYTIIANVLDSRNEGNLAVNQARYTIYVQPSNVHAIINGGQLQILRMGEYLTLDGSDSYDDDIDPMISTGSKAGLSYEWNCFQEFPFVDNSCNVKIISQTNLPHLLITAPVNSLQDSIAFISLFVRDLSGRYAQTFVRVKVVATSSPIIRFDSSDILQSKNKLKTMIIMDGLPDDSQVTWIVGGGNIHVDQVLLTSISEKIMTMMPNSYRHSYFSALLMENLWPWGYQQSLTFQLSSAATNLFISTTLETNFPPRPGIFSVIPSTGRNLLETFKLSAAYWEDEENDLPLEFLFQYQIESKSAQLNELLPIQLKSVRSYAWKKFHLDENLFFSGEAKRNLTMKLFLSVLDSKLAMTTVNQSIILYSKDTSMSLEIPVHADHADIVGNLPFQRQILALSNQFEEPLSFSFSQMISSLYSISTKYYVDPINLNIWTKYLKSSSLTSQSLSLDEFEKGIFLASYYLSQFLFLRMNKESIYDYFSILDHFYQFSALHQVSTADLNVLRLYLNQIILNDLLPGEKDLIFFTNSTAKNNSFTVLYASEEVLNQKIHRQINSFVDFTFDPRGSSTSSTYSPVKLSLWTFFKKNLLIVNHNSTRFATSGSLLTSSSSTYSILSGEILSYPTHVTVQDWGNCGMNGCDLTLVMKNIHPESPNSMESHGNHDAPQTIHCNSQQIESYTISCSLGDPIIVNCDGSYEGSITVTCPYTESSRACGIVDHLDRVNTSRSICQVLSFDEISTTCRCRIGKGSTTLIDDHGPTQKHQQPYPVNDDDEDNVVNQIAFRNQTYSKLFSAIPAMRTSTKSHQSFEIVAMKVIKLVKAEIRRTTTATASTTNAASAEKNSFVQSKTTAAGNAIDSYPRYSLVARSWFTIRQFPSSRFISSYGTIFEAALLSLLQTGFPAASSSIITSVDYLNDTSVIQGDENNVVILLETAFNVSHGFCTIPQVFSYYNQLLKKSVYEGAAYENAIKENAVLMISDQSSLLSANVTAVFSKMMRSHQLFLPPPDQFENCRLLFNLTSRVLPKQGNSNATKESGGKLPPSSSISSQSHSIWEQVDAFAHSSTGIIFVLTYSALLFFIITLFDCIYSNRFTEIRPFLSRQTRKFLGISDRTIAKGKSELKIEEFSKVQQRQSHQAASITSMIPVVRELSIDHPHSSLTVEGSELNSSLDETNPLDSYDQGDSHHQQDGVADYSSLAVTASLSSRPPTPPPRPDVYDSDGGPGPAGRVTSRPPTPPPRPLVYDTNGPLEEKGTEDVDDSNNVRSTSRRPPTPPPRPPVYDPNNQLSEEHANALPALSRSPRYRPPTPPRRPAQQASPDLDKPRPPTPPPRPSAY